MRRAIVTVATGRRMDVGKGGEENFLGTAFADKLERFRDAFTQHSPGADIIAFENSLPPHSPRHEDVPYAFKAYAILEAWSQGYGSILWADSSVFPIRSVEPIWQRIEHMGHWIPENVGWNCGQWTCDSALEPLGLTRERAFLIPQVAATSFGLNLCLGVGRYVLQALLEYADKKKAFQGPWTNANNAASQDKRVLGHRHDQTVLSVIAHRKELPLTKQPAFFSDYNGETPETILVVRR